MDKKPEHLKGYIARRESDRFRINTELTTDDLMDFSGVEESDIKKSRDSKVNEVVRKIIDAREKAGLSTPRHEPAGPYSRIRNCVADRTDIPADSPHR